MRIFNNEAYISAEAAKNYATVKNLTHPKHMVLPNSPYYDSGNNIINLEKTIGASHITGAGTFQTAMLHYMVRFIPSHVPIFVSVPSHSIFKPAYNVSKMFPLRLHSLLCF